MKVEDINKYKLKIRTDFSNKKNQTIALFIEINNNLKELLKEFCIEDKIETTFYDGETTQTIERYKIKTPIFNLLCGYNKDLIFYSDLIDNGLLKLELNKLSQIDSIIDDTKKNLKRVIEDYAKYQNLSLDIVFSNRSIENEN